MLRWMNVTTEGCFAVSPPYSKADGTFHRISSVFSDVN